MVRAERGGGSETGGAPPQPVEAALERLEAIADQLEDPALELDAAVRLYEEGLRLYGECTARLDAADLRITQLATALAKQGRPPSD